MECPYCGHDNIRGADLCDQCGADLAGLDLPREQAEGVRRPFHDVTLEDLSPSTALSVQPGTTVAKAVDLMREHSHGAIFIVDEGGHLLGIFTERDLLTKLALGEQNLDTTLIEEVMTKDPDSLKISAPLRMACNMMGSHGYRHVPIVDDEGVLIGFSSVRGMLKYLHTHVLI
jgi:CBS domain-containing protein